MKKKTDPNTGADCSGFVQYVYAHFGVSLPRALQDQVSCGSTVSSISDAQAGDSKPYPQGGIKVSNVNGTVYKIKRIAH